MNGDEHVEEKPAADALVPTTPQRQESFWKEILKFIVIALVIIVPIRLYVAEPFIVSGASMDPTFANGQYLIVDQISYDVENPHRGDVIIFRYPLNTSLYFIKRVIGLPGETVLVRNGVVTILPPGQTMPTVASPGVTLSEPYIEASHRSYDTSTTTLGADQYFVMGDNRNESSDSRVWGPVPRNLVVGRPIIRLLPPSTFAVFPGRDTAEASEGVTTAN